MSESHTTHTPRQPQPGPAFDHGEMRLRISLALDGLLSAQEAAELHGHLAECSACAGVWATWQAVHQRLAATPAAQPEVGFTARFERRRLQQARRRRLWMGSLVAVLSLVLWGGILVGGVMAFTYLLNNPGNGLPQFLHQFTYFWAGLSAGLEGMWRGITVVMTTSALPWLLLAYGALTLAALTVWTSYLRRSLRPLPVNRGFLRSAS